MIRKLGRAADVAHGVLRHCYPCPVATYVDEAIWEWRGRRWCHLTADSEEELHALAAQLGLVRQWFQSKPGRPWSDHYDLPEDVRVQAIACGALPLSTREMARRQAKLRETHRAGSG